MDVMSAVFRLGSEAGVTFSSLHLVSRGNAVNDKDNKTSIDVFFTSLCV